MEKRIKHRPIFRCVMIFLICAMARVLEYFWIRTDETVLSENFLHKVFGILILAVALNFLHYKWEEIGFKKDGIVFGILKGMLLGLCCFAVAYSIECLILFYRNQNVSLAFYASGFSLEGESRKQTDMVSFLLCVIFNMINVWMEEGVFRGLFMKILTSRHSFSRAALRIAFLFGIWHWVMPLRDYVEGNSTLASLLIMGIGYVVLAGVMSIKWSLLYQVTGSLWMGLGDHLFNNIIATNLLHVISNGEADSMQIVRILIGQMLSFAVVLICYRKQKQKT